MIVSRRGLIALTAWTLVGLAGALWPAAIGIWVATGVLLGVAFLADAVWALRRPAPVVEREMPPAISSGVSSSCLVEVVNPGSCSMEAMLFDHHPPDFDAEGMPHGLRLASGEKARTTYRLLPRSRGTFEFGPVELRVSSPLRLWERVHRIPVDTSVRVYPNFEAIRRYQILATDHRTSDLGIKRRQRRGEGLEFHQLREYRVGDALRQIDWKATSRLGKAISREYEDERDQQVMVMLDCGRRMRAQDGDASHLDAALDAALLISHVALRQGDAVGLGTFGGTERWLAPRKGLTQVNAMLEAVFDLQPRASASDHLKAATDLAARVRKRSLVLWVSNLRDDDDDELAEALQVLGKTHLVILASLRESVLDRRLDEPIVDLEGAVRVAAIHRYLEERRQSLRRFRAKGVRVIDCAPEQLPAALVNGYLSVKAAGLL